MKRLFIIIIFSFLLQSCSTSVVKKINSGQLNLGQTTEYNKMIRLDGEWEFFWNQLLNPWEIKNYNRKNKTYIQVPGDWTHKHTTIKTISNQGYATYHLSIALNNGDYFLILPKIYSAATVWINDQKAATFGSPGKTKDNEISNFHSVLIPVTISSKNLDIVINVSNHTLAHAGIRTSIKLGKSDIFNKTILTTTIKNLVTFFISFLSGVLFIIISLTIREDNRKHYLYFGLTILFLSVRLLLLNSNYIYFYFPNLPSTLLLRFEWMLAVLPNLTGLLFVITKYPKESKLSLASPLIVLGILFSLMMLLLNIYWMTSSLYIIYTYSAATVLCGSYFLYRALQNHQKDALILFSSMLIMLTSIITEFFLRIKLNFEYNFINIGFVFLLFSYSVSLIRHLINNSQKLNNYQNNLEEMIQARTTQFENSKMQLERKIHQLTLSRSKLKKFNQQLSSQVDKTQKAQKALKESEKRFRELANLLPEIVYETDADLNFTYVNKVTVEKFGYSKEEFLTNINSRDLLIDEHINLMLYNTFENSDNNTRTVNEYTFKKKDGTTFTGLINGKPIKERGRIIGFRGIVVDITKIKESEEKIKNLQIYLANIINSMPSAIIGFDKKYNITLWNKEAEEKYKKSKTDVVGQNIYTICPDISTKKSIISKSLDTGEIKNIRTSRDKEQSKRHENIIIFPLEKESEGAVIRIDDITEQARMEELIIHSEKMLSVGGLATGMAHEINNPLAGMTQNANMILRRMKRKNAEKYLQKSEDYDIINDFFKKRHLYKFLNYIVQSGYRAAKIVDNMLSFAKQGRLIYSNEDINDVINETLKLIVNDYDMKNKFNFQLINIETEFNFGKKIKCEKNKLQQVILNLLKNAAEAVYEKYRISEDSYIPKIKIKTEEKATNVIITIEDNGTGIPDIIKTRIFEPFYTTKNSGKGLGLAVSYFIITKNHDGHIELESSNEHGSKFIITIPIKEK